MLSTCKAHRGVRRRRALPRRLRRHPRLPLRARGPSALDELHPHLYSHHDEAAARHLFEVAAGLDSVVLGEARSSARSGGAWQLAATRAGSRSTLDLLFRQRSARRQAGPHTRRRSDGARRRSATPRSRWSADRLGTLAGRRVLVVGAGDMGGVGWPSLRKVGPVDRRRQPHARARAAPRRQGRRARGRPRRLGEALADSRRRRRLRRRARRVTTDDAVGPPPDGDRC